MGISVRHAYLSVRFFPIAALALVLALLTWRAVTEPSRIATEARNEIAKNTARLESGTKADCRFYTEIARLPGDVHLPANAKGPSQTLIKLANAAAADYYAKGCVSYYGAPPEVPHG